MRARLAHPQGSRSPRSPACGSRLDLREPRRLGTLEVQAAPRTAQRSVLLTRRVRTRSRCARRRPTRSGAHRDQGDAHSVGRDGSATRRRRQRAAGGRDSAQVVATHLGVRRERGFDLCGRRARALARAGSHPGVAESAGMRRLDSRRVRGVLPSSCVRNLARAAVAGEAESRARRRRAIRGGSVRALAPRRVLPHTLSPSRGRRGAGLRGGGGKSRSARGPARGDARALARVDAA